MKNICYFERFHHIMCISICSKSCKDSSVYKFHCRRASAGISHIGFRIMNNHCVCIFDQIHLMWVDVDTMSKQCLLSKNIEVHQTVNNSLSIMFQAVMQIFNSFCNMNMITNFIRFVCCCKFHCLI